MTNKFIGRISSLRQADACITALCLMFSLFFGFTLPIPFSDGKADSNRFLLMPSAKASSIYFNVASTNLNLTLTAAPAAADLIDTNHDWSLIPSVQGYRGEGLS
ncbi:MAG TPA: hypothetical protein VEQ18_04185, partial [Candidatus Nitrosocosmicus sp.]|nr:hypothetical protein [Candidatus Nitrosocosmicus sp.]